MSRINRGGSRGFTLIEIMLVLVVISVMASMLALSIGDSPVRQLEREAKRVQAVLQMAADEAQMQGVELALSLTDNPDQEASGYLFLQFDIDQQQWQPLTGKPFGLFEFSEDISVELQLKSDGQSDVYQQQLSLLTKMTGESSYSPQVLLFSSGEMTPFELSFRHPQSSVVIKLISDGVSGIERYE